LSNFILDCKQLQYFSLSLFERRYHRRGEDHLPFQLPFFLHPNALSLLPFHHFFGKSTLSQILKKAKKYNKNLTLNNTSDVLRNFVKKNITVCLNEDAKIGRLYRLTEMGKKIRNEIPRL